MVGNTSNFSKIDVLRCFLRLIRESGRQELAKDLELGEGTIRTILDSLKSNGLLDSTKKGHILSRKGGKALAEILKNIEMKRASIKSIYPKARKVAVVVRNAPSLKRLHRLRDIAVKNGADGAVILKFDGKLYAPESSYGSSFNELENLFDLRRKDALIVSFSYDWKSAENGALVIAAELKHSLKKFISKF